MGEARTLPITLSAVDDVSHKCSYVWLNYDTDGSRQDPDGYFDDWGSEYDFISRGHYRLSTLPEITLILIARFRRLGSRCVLEIFQPQI